MAREAVAAGDGALQTSGKDGSAPEAKGLAHIARAAERRRAARQRGRCGSVVVLVALLLVAQLVCLVGTGRGPRGDRSAAEGIDPSVLNNIEWLN